MEMHNCLAVIWAHKRCIVLLAFTTIVTTLCAAQLTNTATSTWIGCPTSAPKNATTYTNWTFKDPDDVIHSFADETYLESHESWNPAPCCIANCGVNSEGSLNELSGDRLYYLQAEGPGGTASPSAIAYPQYQVLSIIYAAPGNRSSNGYTNSTTDGTTTSITQSFTSGSTVTFTTGFSFLGIGASASTSFGESQTTGNSSAFTETMTDSTGWANASGGTSNQINHQDDLFLIWINPAIQIVSTGSKTWTYSVGTQLQSAGDPSPGSPEVQDIVEVFASAMSANASGATTVPLEALVPQVVDGETLPGLAVICANHSFYPNSCTQANQCGCVPNDFKTILAQDPLRGYSSTESPLNADTSGATACAKPTASDKCRYVPVPSSPGSSVQETELLCGPQSAGGNDCSNTFTQSDSNTTTQTLSETDSYTVGYSWGLSLFGSGLSSTTQFTMTNSESTGQTNGSANSMTVTLSSSTLDCYQEIPIFEDTVYHTFVFQQPAGNSSCP
jgi:hypothetical protein